MDVSFVGFSGTESILYQTNVIHYFKGLCAARHVTVQQDMVPIIYEQSNAVGGVWNYTDNIGTDENGLKIHSAMYKNLL